MGGHVLRKAMALLTALLCLVGSVHALFEDEAGKLDFQIENIGRVLHAAFEGNKIYVGTASAVVAALDGATGKLEWRSVLEPSDEIDAVLPLRHYVLSVSSKGRVARLWSALDGALVWDAFLPLAADPDTQATPRPVAAVAATSGTEIYVLSGDTIYTLQSSSGAILHSYAPKPAESKEVATAVGGSDVNVQLTDVRPRPGGGAIAAGLAVRKGRVEHLLEVSIPPLPAEAEICSMKVGRSGIDASQGASLLAMPGGGHKYAVTALAAGGKGLYIMESTCGGGGSVSSVTEVEVPVVAPAAQAGTLVGSGGAMLELIGEGAVAVKLAGAGEGAPLHLETAAECPRGSAGKCLLGGAAVRDAAVGKSFPAPFKSVVGRGDVKALYLAPEAAEGAASPPRLLALMEDDALVMLRDETVEWVREEALAGVTSVDFVDQAVDELTVLARQANGDVAAGVGAAEHHIPGFRERLQLQWLELQALVARAVAAVTNKPVPAELAALASRDAASSFGFKKLAICATATGSLVAINMDGGAVAWSRFMGSKATDVRVFATRPKSVLGYAPEFVTISPGGGASGADGSITSHDGLTGKAIGAKWTIPGGLSAVVPLDAHESEDRQLLMLVDNNLRVRVWPATAETHAIFSKLLPNVYHHSLKNSGLTSFAVVADDASSEQLPAEERSYASREAAAMAFPPDVTIAAVAYRNRKDVLESPAKVLGDESLLLKYLNPHLVGVFTLGPAPAPQPSQAAATAAGGAVAAPEGGELTLMLVDTVSARVLQRITHQEAKEPVHAVVVENRLVYSYWNARARRTEIGSISLFEGVIEKHALNPMNRPEYKDTFSSFEAHAPITVQRTFVFPHAVEAMGATVTGQGITAKNVLIGFGAGQLLSLESNWVDARRPLSEPTKAEQAERLPQYHPFLPAVRNHVVSHTRTIERMRDIYAAPAALESTSLVLAVGLDVFGARVTPSQAFDLLSSEFQYTLLLLVLAGMAAFNVVASVVAKRKELAALWA